MRLAISLILAITLITPFGAFYCTGILCQLGPIEGIKGYVTATGFLHNEPYSVSLLVTVNNMVFTTVDCVPWGGRDGRYLWVCVAIPNEWKAEAPN